MNVLDAPCEMWDTQSSGVVSLLELLKFNAHEFVMVSRKISWIETMAKELERRAPHMLNNPVILENTTPEGAIEGFAEMREIARGLGLDSAEDQMTRLINKFREGMTAIEIAQGLTELQNRIDDQLARRVFYQFKPEVACYFEEPNPFGEKVAAAFPSAAHDITEAGKCYACERYEATVYHLMRAMEVALRCLAKNIHVPYAPNWMNYLDQIDKALRLKPKKTAATKARAKFHGNASSLLRAVKEAWRDDTMHIAGRYGSDQTREIWQSCKAFMGFLAEGLSEKI